MRSRTALLVAMAAVDAGIFMGARGLAIFPAADMRGWMDSSAPAAIHAGLPKHHATRPLDQHDLTAYRAVFAAQEAGDFAGADTLMATIDNDSLAGMVLYRRYTDSRYHPAFGELKAWLDAYADQPGAGRIYRMALDRAPARQAYLLALPATSDWANSEMRALSDQALAYQPDHPRAASVDLAVASLRKAVRAAVRRGDTAEALRVLADPPGQVHPDPVEYDQMRAEIAHGLYNAGRYQAAQNLAGASLARSGGDAPEAAWIAGLIAWRDKHYFTAAQNFELVAQSPYASGWTVSAGAFWAARAYRKAGETDKVAPMLAEAAAWPRTFYGMIANRALNRRPDFDWKAPVYTEAHATMLSAQPAFQRAIALHAIGQDGLAQQQLLTINPGSSPAMREALVAYALHAGMPALSMRLAGIYPRANGRMYDAALYPLPLWKTSAAGKADHAFVLSVVRQESGFDTDAVSARGAVGLMQVMPGTAGAVAPDANIVLKDPETNLELGRRYLATLHDADGVGGRMIPMLVAYNAGPGNLARWKQQYADALADPLMFIESIPSAETRVYVQHVVANDWIYRQRLDLPAPLLDQAVKGTWTLGTPSASPVAAAARPKPAMTLATAR